MNRIEGSVDDREQHRTAPLPRREVILAAALFAAPTIARAEWLRDEVVVYADPALRQVIEAIGTNFPKAQRVRCFCAAPAQMVALLAHGTQDDVLITQAAAMAQAQRLGIVTAPAKALWRNRLVFAAAAQNPAQVDFSAAALRAAVGGGTLSLVDRSDACAIDGPALLQRLGAGGLLAGHIVGAADTGDAVATLQRGEATVALCHASEVAAARGIGVLMRVPDDAYDPIIYAAALSRTAWSRYNTAFMTFLAGAAAPAARRFGLEILA